MAIHNNGSYVSTMNLFLSHWTQANAALAPAVLVLTLPDKSALPLAAFTTLRNRLQAQQLTVQARLSEEMIARGDIDLQKAALLGWFNEFTGLVDGYYQGTKFIAARPLAPGITDGQETFSRPLGLAMTLWEKINLAPAPAGVTLPLTLADGTGQGTFASALSALQFAYATEANADQDVTLARAERNAFQDTAYEAMKTYRVVVPSKLALHPPIVETLPRLTPLPGHTPEPVNVSGIFIAPDESKIVHELSDDPTLLHYELRGTVGDRYDENDAAVIATHRPTDPPEFLTDFGLTQPGAKVTLKVFVILTTGNEAGSAGVTMERPAQAQSGAA